MLVEIALCTWNRAALLEKTLVSLAHLDVPAGINWRVILVDNGSTDGTGALVRRMADQLPLRVVSEPEPGHCVSRNRAIAEARGDLLLWTDDDVRVAPGWLARYVDAALGQREADFWGGAIVPVFLKSKPNWIGENWDILGNCYAARDLGPQPRELSGDALPYGANFAVRTSVQKQFAFDTRLGRQRTLAVGFDELDLMLRMLAAGHRGVWVPDNAVEHLIDARRASARFVWNYFFGHGHQHVVRRAQTTASTTATESAMGGPVQTRPGAPKECEVPDQMRPEALLADGRGASALAESTALIPLGGGVRDEIRALRREARRQARRYVWKRWWAPSPVWLAHLIRWAQAAGRANALASARR